MATRTWTSSSSTSFSTAGNWTPSGAPANGDVLFLNHLGTASIETDLGSTLTGITLNVEKSYTGRIGVLTSTTQTYLTFDGGTINLGIQPVQGSPAGSPLLMIANTSTTAMTVNVLDSSSTSYSTNYPPVLLKGTDMTVNGTGGKVGIAALPGETSTGTYKTTAGSGSVAPFIFLGSGVTITALSANAGTINSRSANTCTAATISGNAVYQYDGTGAHTALTVNSGATCYYNGTGTITDLDCSGTFNGSRDTRAKTITDSIFRRGATLDIDNGVAGAFTFTNASEFPDGIGEVTINSPSQVKALIDNI